jgi:ubiquinone biosynthesis protein COQ9
MIKQKQEIIKQSILIEAKKSIPFVGFKPQLLKELALSAGHPYALVREIFPDGNRDLIKLYLDSIDSEMIAAISNDEFKRLKTSERLAKAIEVRLNIYDKLFVKKLVAYLGIPSNFLFKMEVLWRTSDLLWKHAGFDQSTDFNYYTKRATLATIYAATLIFWLSDDSLNAVDSIEFLKRSFQRNYDLVNFFKGI